MASEEWKIIFESTSGDGGGSSEGGEEAGGSKGTAETPQQRKQLVEDATKVFGAVAGVSGILAMVIKGMRDSIIFSTAFNSIMMIISAIADVFLIAFWPLVMVVIQALLNFIPIAAAVGKALAPLIEKIAQGLNTWLATGDPNQFIDASVDFITSIAEDVGKWFSANGGKIVQGIEKAVVGFFTMLGKLQPVWDAVGKMFEGMKPAMIILAQWLGENFVEPLMIYIFQSLLYGIIRVFTEAATAIALAFATGIATVVRWVTGQKVDMWAMDAEFQKELKKMNAEHKAEYFTPTLKLGTAAFPAEAMARATEEQIRAQQATTEETKRTNTILERIENKSSTGPTININAQLNGPAISSTLASSKQLSFGGI